MQGDTTLIGGAIASSDAAVDAGRNVLTTAGIVTEDLYNRADYQGRGFGLTAGFGHAEGDPEYRGSRMGVGSDSGSADGVTRAGVSGIAGHEAIRTGDASGGIAPIVDVQQLEADLDAQVAITGEFGQQASTAWGDHANAQYREAERNGDRDGMACWAADGNCRTAGHLLIGGASGGVDGALGAGLSTQLSPRVIDALRDHGLPEGLVEPLTLLTAAGAGGALGGAEGVAAGYNEAGNNAYAAALQGIQRCAHLPACAGALVGALGSVGIDASGMLEALGTSQADDVPTLAQLLADGPEVWGTEYPAHTDALPDRYDTPAHADALPDRYDTPIAEQNGWASELPIAGPVQGDHTSGGYQPVGTELIGGAVYSENGFDLSVKASSFEESLYRLPPGERVAAIKQAAIEAANYHGLQKDSRLSRMNSRDVYVSPDGAVYSLDTQHGRFEKINSRTGQHEGEVRLYDLEPVPGSVDRSGGHNLRVR